MKKLTALILALLMILGIFAGCSDSSSGTGDIDKKPDFDKPTNAVDIADPTNPAQNETTAPIIDTNKLENDDLRYVMIYNPNIYDAAAPYLSVNLETGNISSQINVDANRGGLEDANKTVLANPTPNEVLANMNLTMVEPELNRAEIVIPEYKIGDKKKFYTFDSDEKMSRIEAEFECLYKGEHCYVWSADSNFKKADATKYGTEFDTKIFDALKEVFDTPRFVKSGGKVHIMIKPLANGLGGVFFNPDAYATGEISDEMHNEYKNNFNHDIVTINSIYNGYIDDSILFSTLAHETQHLILASHRVSNGLNPISTPWINEVMSGYIEEYLYPGIQLDSGRYRDYETSNRIRYGQSLYNFNCDTDIGVYGSVYLFSQYLINVAGKDVFSNYHNLWAMNYNPYLSDAESLSFSVSTEGYAKADNLITYPDTISFNSEDEEWLSKLALDFYLTTLRRDGTEPANFANFEPSALLYDQTLSATIEGGGRIIVEANGTCFEIPEDADSGLVYVGMDKDFNVVTDFVIS